MCIGESSSLRTDTLVPGTVARPWWLRSWPEAERTGNSRSLLMGWNANPCAAWRSLKDRGSKPITTSSPAAFGSASCFLKHWETSSVRPSRTSSFFGPPAGDSRFTDAHLPVWGDHGERFFYGIPGSDRRGFKVADVNRGSELEPTSGERVVSQATLKRVREYLAFRIPRMKDAPLIETRVCQYEQTPDSHFVADRHPRMRNVWLIGGDSRPGFKHGPAVGELTADLIFNNENRVIPGDYRDSQARRHLDARISLRLHKANALIPMATSPRVPGSGTLLKYPSPA
jgi:hypothetical protein